MYQSLIWSQHDPTVSSISHRAGTIILHHLISVCCRLSCCFQVVHVYRSSFRLKSSFEGCSCCVLFFVCLFVCFVLFLLLVFLFVWVFWGFLFFAFLCLSVCFVLFLFGFGFCFCLFCLFVWFFFFFGGGGFGLSLFLCRSVSKI